MSSLVSRFVLVVVAIAMIASSIGIASAYTYNRQATIDYARANAYNDVPGSAYYYKNGGDCTNFVSQSLKVGGWLQRGTEWASNYRWYFNPYNSLPYWPFSPDASTSWMRVSSFKDFVVTSQRGTEIPFARNDITARPTRFKVGDIIQADWTDDKTWDHSMIITGITSNNILLTYHSNNQKDKPITEVIAESPPSIKFRVLLLKDTFSY